MSLLEIGPWPWLNKQNSKQILFTGVIGVGVWSIFATLKRFELVKLVYKRIIVYRKILFFVFT